jgi:hypothetical protein
MSVSIQGCVNILKGNTMLMSNTSNCLHLEREVGACLILSARENSTAVIKCNDFYHAGILI